MTDFDPLSQPIRTPSFAGGLLSALGNIPQAMQAEKVRNAQADEIISRDEDARLSQLAQMAESNPSLKTDPRTLGAVESIFKRRGMPAPITQDGTFRELDLNALVPKKMPRDMTAQERTELMAMPPDQRRAALEASGYNVGAFPAAFLTMKPYETMSAGEKTLLLSNASKGLVDAISKGTPPEVIGGMLRSQRDLYERVGIDVNQILTDPGIQAAFEQRADIKTASLVQLGIVKPGEEFEYKNKMLAFDRDKLNATLGEKRREFNIDEQRKQAEDRIKMQRLSMDMAAKTQQLSIQQQRLSAYVTRVNDLVSADQYRQFQQTVKPIISQYNTTENQWNQIQTQIRGYVAAGSTPPDDLVQKATALQNTLTAMKPDVERAEQMQSNYLVSSTRAVTGQQAVPVSPPTQQTDAQPKTRVNPANGKTYYLHSDGKYYLQP